MRRAKTGRWWVESIAALAVIGGYVFWQGKNWEDMTEAKTAMVVVLVEGFRSFRRDLGSDDVPTLRSTD